MIMYDDELNGISPVVGSRNGTQGDMPFVVEMVRYLPQRRVEVHESVSPSIRCSGCAFN